MQKKFGVSFFLASLIVGSAVFAQNMQGMFFVTPTMIKWAQAPGYLPKGTTIAVLEGDMSKAAPYVVRLNLPEKSIIPPHTHQDIEQVTVISGDVYVGVGDVIDMNNATPLPAGSFFTIPPGTHHYLYTKTPAIIQLHGVGPWGINYINSKK